MIKWKRENTYYTHHLWETVITKVIKHSVKGSADSFSLLPSFVSNKGRLLIFVTFKFIIYYSKGSKDKLYFHKRLWSCPIFQSCRRTETLCYGIGPFMHYGYGDFTIQSNSSHLSHCLASLDYALGDAASFRIAKHTPLMKAKRPMRDWSRHPKCYCYIWGRDLVFLFKNHF